MCGNRIIIFVTQTQKIDEKKFWNRGVTISKQQVETYCYKDGNITEIAAHQSPIFNTPQYSIEKERQVVVVVDMSENPNGAKQNPCQGKLHPAPSFGKVPQKQSNESMFLLSCARYFALSCDTCGNENVMLVFYLMKVVIFLYFWDQVSFFFFFLINQNVVEQGTQSERIHFIVKFCWNMNMCVCVSKTEGVEKIKE